MPLHKIEDFDPNYLTYFGDNDILGYDLYSGNEKIGAVDDLLVDDGGKFRYFVVNAGDWFAAKKVLLPIGRSRISYRDRRVSVDGLTREQVKNLPDYSSGDLADYDYEERIRSIYRPDASAPSVTRETAPSAYDRNSYSYDYDPNLYTINEQNHQNLRLYEERLVADKTRQKAGEVTLGKRVETQRAQVSVPIEKEKVVIEEVNSSTARTVVTPDGSAFQEGEVARMEVYEETPDIRKEAFVREQVSVRKEVEHEVVDTEYQIRREQLDVKTAGHPTVETRHNPLTDEHR